MQKQKHTRENNGDAREATQRWRQQIKREFSTEYYKWTCLIKQSDAFVLLRVQIRLDTHTMRPHVLDTSKQTKRKPLFSVVRYYFASLWSMAFALMPYCAIIRINSLDFRSLSFDKSGKHFFGSLIAAHFFFVFSGVDVIFVFESKV